MKLNESGTFNKNRYDSDPTANFFDAVGGDREKWKEFLEKIGQIVERQFPRLDWEDKVNLTYDVEKKFNVEKFKNPYILNPADYETQQEFFDAIEHWWIFRYRKKERTIKDRVRYAKKMSEHPLFPINWKELNPNQIIAYLENKEYNEYPDGKGKHQIRNEWKTIKTIAKACGVNADLWGYIPPNPPPAKVRVIPLPITTYEIIHHKYSKNKYNNALFQYILMHGFIIGWRPCEIVIQKVSDVKIDEGYMLITETKKGNQLRQVFLEKQLMSGRQYKSMKNLIDYWRPKVVNQYSGDYLYLQSNGRPFTADYLRKLLTPKVKEVYPYYSLYTMRHWCAIARLIKDYIEKSTWDKTDVQDWLGHDKVSTTDNYTKFAKKYYRIAPFDWIKTILKFHKKEEEENGQKSTNGQKRALLNKSTGVNRYAPVGI